MPVLAALLAALGAGVAALVAAALLRDPPAPLRVRNFRGAEVPVVGGVVIACAFLAAEAALALAATLRPLALSGRGSALPRVFLSSDHAGLAVVALAFFALGLLDDLGGSERSRGFRGHARALAGGRLTGGAIKALGGGAAALVAGGLWELRLGPALLDAGIVALAANLVNLLDLRPGRAAKAFLLAWAPLAVAGAGGPYLPLSAPMAAAAAAWLPADLGERGMLGDAGANPLGAVVGAGLALTLPTGGKVAALGVLVALTAASERWSFGGAIRRAAPLRWLDGLGRRPE